MIIISHRGNIDGPNPERENRIDYIIEALSQGFHVEVDVIGKDGELYLGHDAPQEIIGTSFLSNPNLWVHAKNIEAVELLLPVSGIHWFFHKTDDVAFTSKGAAWTYPGKKLLKGAVAVLPENEPTWDISNAGAVCTDYPMKYVGPVTNIRVFIVTYRNPGHLNANLRSLFGSRIPANVRISVNVINNHSTFSLDPEFNDRVRVLHNELRPDFSTGHLARNWNQAIINGFEDLNSPACDLLIHTQDDVIWDPDWCEKLLPIMDEMTFYTSGNGDAFCCYRPEAVKSIGIWDERFCNIGFHEYDYFLRAIIFNREKSSINDIGKMPGWYDHNVKDPVTQSVSRGNQKEKDHSDSQQYHHISRRFFEHKWGYSPEKARSMKADEMKEKLKMHCHTYMLYPYFEKNISDLASKNYQYLQ